MIIHVKDILPGNDDDGMLFLDNVAGERAGEFDVNSGVHRKWRGQQKEGQQKKGDINPGDNVDGAQSEFKAGDSFKSQGRALLF